MATPAARKPRAKKPVVKRKTSSTPRPALRRDFLGLGLVALGALLLLSAFFQDGWLTSRILFVVHWLVGRIGVWGVAGALIAFGGVLMARREKVELPLSTLAVCLLFLVAVAMAQLGLAPHQLWQPAEFAASPGGLFGSAIAVGLHRLMGGAAWVVLVATGLLGVALLTDIPPWQLLLWPVKLLYLPLRWMTLRLIADMKAREERRRAARVAALQDAERRERAGQGKTSAPAPAPTPTAATPRQPLPALRLPAIKLSSRPEEDDPDLPDIDEPDEPVVGVPSRSKPGQLQFNQLDPTGNDRRPYSLPSLDLLAAPPRNAGTVKDDSAEKILILEEKLRSFGIDAKVVGVERGPRVTRFEVLPPPGVRISKITNLSDDLALSLAALDVRVEAPVPGKGVVGIEVPNTELQLVSLREIMESDAFRKAKTPLAFALGRDIAGHPRIADLTKMPHLLIAGATNSGKSVCINTLLCSILMRATPQQVKLLLVDPKRVELSLFQHIPHLIAPVAYDAKHAAGLLRWAIREMEARYAMFADKGVRNIVGFNEQSRLEGLEELPYIVIIIDELADLMMQAAAEFEASICRIAQLARATGIHLVVATQRPSVNVITGTIKANIPSRIAFAVASQVDSRTILDMNGAERLVGQGDMLYLPVDASKPARIQGAYVSEVEINRIVTHVKGQGKPLFSDEIVAIEEEAMRSEDGEGFSDEPEDELFEKALDYIRTTKYASTSMLQRKFRIGYTRAARLMDIFEERGFVGPGQGSKPREVIFAPASSVVTRPTMPDIPDDDEDVGDEE